MHVVLTHRAAKDLDRLHRNQPRLFEKVMSSIESLGDDPLSGKQLVGPLNGKRSLRVGAYRVVYEILKGEVVVLTVNHRGGVYR